MHSEPPVRFEFSWRVRDCEHHGRLALMQRLNRQRRIMMIAKTLVAAALLAAAAFTPATAAPLTPLGTQPSAAQSGLVTQVHRRHRHWHHHHRALPPLPPRLPWPPALQLPAWPLSLPRPLAHPLPLALRMAGRGWHELAPARRSDEPSAHLRRPSFFGGLVRRHAC